MKFTAVFAIVFAAGASARNCKEGLDYCGQTLLSIGKYQPQIDQALADAGAREVNGGRDDLFHCEGGANGVIRYIRHCDYRCKDNGDNKSDTCN